MSNQSSYIISGPTTIGNEGLLNTIQGDITLPHIALGHGDLLYINAEGKLARIAPGTAGTILQSNGQAAPAWVPQTSQLSNGFSARYIGNQTFSTTTTLAPWSTGTKPEYNDTNGDFNAATGVFTPTSDGKYLVVVGVSFTHDDNTNDRLIQILLNGVDVIYRDTFQPSNNVVSSQRAHISTTVKLSAGDTLEIQLGNDAGSANITPSQSPESWFSVTRLA